MYEIYKINDDQYQLHSKFAWEGKEGTQLAILIYAVRVLGFSPNELEFAFIDMIRKDHDAAHFGVNKYFIFSFNRSERKAG